MSRRYACLLLVPCPSRPRVQYLVSEEVPQGQQAVATPGGDGDGYLHHHPVDGEKAQVLHLRWEQGSVHPAAGQQGPQGPASLGDPSQAHEVPGLFTVEAVWWPGQQDLLEHSQDDSRGPQA